MTDTIIRQVKMLSWIPRYPSKISTRELAARLKAAELETTQRTIQRDLTALSRVFAIACDDSSKPYGWYWLREAKSIDIPTMEPPVALTFTMTQQFLRPLLPASATGYLDPYFDRAEAVLEETAGENRWWHKVRMVPRAMSLLPAEVNKDLLRTVFDALRYGKRFEATYCPRGQAPKTYRVNPLGLVFRNSAFYVVCTLWDYKDIKQLAVHRFEDLTLLEDPVSPVDGFDLDGYIEKGEFDFPVEGDPMIDIAVRLDRSIAIHLQETPVSTDQKLTSLDQENVLLRAKVKNTLQLRWWLRGFGAKAEVMGPAFLREEFAEDVKASAKAYKKAPAGSSSAASADMPESSTALSDGE